MRKLDPNDIPNILTMVAKVYSENRNPNDKENEQINTFFTMYMGKAMEDCQDASMALWSPLKPKSDLCFSSKVVAVDPKDENKGKVEFIVATTRSVRFEIKDVEIFKVKTQEKVMQEFGNAEDWVMVYNRLMFGMDKKTPNSKFVNGLFIGIRFSKEFFLTAEE